MLETNRDSKLDGLLARLVDETITQRELTDLEDMLDGNHEAQQRYLRYLGLHADLQMGSWRGSEISVASPIRKQRWVSSAALFGMGALIVTVALLWGPWQDEEESTSPIARVVDMSGSIHWFGDLGGHGDILKVGSSLTGGTLELLAADSWTEIAFLDGSTVSVSGTATVTLSDGVVGKQVYIKHGDVSINAVPQPAGAPLRVVTPSAEAEVLGTQFNVTVDPQSTRLSVNEGSIRVVRLADGRVQKVETGQFVVAALEQNATFESHPRPNETSTWESELPGDIKLGHWVPATGESPGAVGAKANLWLENPDKPQLHYSVVVGPNGISRTTPRLSAMTQIRFRGRIKRSHDVYFGFMANRVRGGFAGKYNVWQKIDTSGAFEVVLPLEVFKRSKACFPESPIGLEFQHCWIVTLNEDIGLEIDSVEITE